MPCASGWRSGAAGRPTTAAASRWKPAPSISTPLPSERHRASTYLVTVRVRTVALYSGVGKGAAGDQPHQPGLGGTVRARRRWPEARAGAVANRGSAQGPARRPGRPARPGPVGPRGRASRSPRPGSSPREQHRGLSGRATSPAQLLDQLGVVRAGGLVRPRPVRWTAGAGRAARRRAPASPGARSPRRRQRSAQLSVAPLHRRTASRWSGSATRSAHRRAADDRRQRLQPANPRAIRSADGAALEPVRRPARPGSPGRRTTDGVVPASTQAFRPAGGPPRGSSTGRRGRLVGEPMIVRGIGSGSATRIPSRSPGRG